MHPQAPRDRCSFPLGLRLAGWQVLSLLQPAPVMSVVVLRHFHQAPPLRLVVTAATCSSPGVMVALVVVLSFALVRGALEVLARSCLPLARLVLLAQPAEACIYLLATPRTALVVPSG